MRSQSVGHRAVVIYALTTLAMAACGGGGGGGGPPPSATISGSISGLTGTAVLQDNGGDNLTLHANGSFKFSIPVLLGQPYSVTVLTQPTGPNCSVANGAGTLTANVNNVSVVCAVDPTAFYVPVATYALSPGPGTPVSSGMPGLYVIATKDVGIAPISILSGGVNSVGHSRQLAIDSSGHVTGGQPLALVFSTLGAAGGDHVFALDLTGNSQLTPTQISSLTLSYTPSTPLLPMPQICGSVEAYENLTDPSSEFFILGVPTVASSQCGGVKNYLIHLTDTPTTSPVELPGAANGALPLYHASGALAGFVAVDAANNLDFYAGKTFSNPNVLLANVSTIAPVLSGPTQVPAYPTFYFLLVAGSGGNSYSVRRVDDTGAVSADLYDFQGNYAGGGDQLITDATNLYLTDQFGSSGTPTQRIAQIPIDGSRPALTLFQEQTLHPYTLVGPTVTQLVVENEYNVDASSGTISTTLATLPLGMAGSPTVIASFPNSGNATTESMMSADDVYVTQTTATAVPSYSYASAIVNVNGTVIQPLTSNSSFLPVTADPLLQVTGITGAGGLGGGHLATIGVSQPSAPPRVAFNDSSGKSFAFPANIEFASNSRVTSAIGVVMATQNGAFTAYVYDVSKSLIAPVAISNTGVGFIAPF
jgi:hypothetical protein